MKNESRRTQAKNFRNRFSAWDSVHARVRERVEWVCNANVRWTWKLKDFYLLLNVFNVGKESERETFFFFPRNFPIKLFFTSSASPWTTAAGAWKKDIWCLIPHFTLLYVCLLLTCRRRLSTEHISQLQTQDSSFGIYDQWRLTSPPHSSHPRDTCRRCDVISLTLPVRARCV